jgi:hypothetical protein
MNTEDRIVLRWGGVLMVVGIFVCTPLTIGWYGFLLGAVIGFLLGAVIGWSVYSYRSNAEKRAVDAVERAHRWLPLMGCIADGHIGNSPVSPRYERVKPLADADLPKYDGVVPS